MDISLPIGLVLAAGSIVAGIIFAGVPISAFIDVPSILVVVGGTLGACIINFPLKKVIGVMKVLPVTLQAKEYDPVPVVNQLIELADQGVRKGPAALEQMAADLPDPFIQRGVTLVAAQLSDEQIRYAMETELDFVEERHGEGVAVIDAFAAFAPAFGLLVTLIGLVAMLQALAASGGGGVAGVATGMAVALITTFYGAFLQNIFGIPIAGKLKTVNAAESAYKRLVIEGVLMVSQGIRESLPPKALADRISQYLSPGRREEIAAGGGAAA
ncbi:MAG: MotA/TolQ/ExbB proton channel family protein [Candidatus Poribacteria bacterium]|nr:MotA/TolQ/ExbB proton channel family protein [Candidatus Poribacteria bacterium]